MCMYVVNDQIHNQNPANSKFGQSSSFVDVVVVLWVNFVFCVHVCGVGLYFVLEDTHKRLL